MRRKAKPVREKTPPKYEDLGDPCEIFGTMIRFKRLLKQKKAIWWALTDIKAVAHGKPERRLCDDGAIVEVETTDVFMSDNAQLQVEGHPDKIAAIVLAGIENLRRMCGE